MAITSEPTDLWKAGVPLIPTPQGCTLSDGEFTVTGDMVIQLSAGADDEDAFAAELLARRLGECTSARPKVWKTERKSAGGIRFERKRLGKDLREEGYLLEITSQQVTLTADSAAGTYYGVQTLLQMIRRSAGRVTLPCIQIEDRPDFRWRAITYDTKHHQDTFDYVADFIRKMAGYKLNMIIWEWEDKLAYERRPEIGAPGAFTKKQVQRLTAIARRHHVQLVPLVQGLGHVGFILKHRKHRRLREVPASNWQFCPQKDGTYELLFDLWDEAMEATPGVDFIHIGTDECYELGLGETCGCSKLAAEHGKDYLMQMFVRRAHKHIAAKGRKVISWGGGYVEGSPHKPPKDLITFDYPYKTRAPAMRAIEKGYTKWVFCPNPLNCPLVVPMWPFEFAGRRRDGSAMETARSLDEAHDLGGFTGYVACTWDDPGRHNEMWNIRHVCAAEFGWTAHAPSVDEFLAKFFVNYFGPEQQDLLELYRSMEDRMFFYYSVLQRRVWHYGPVGKMHLPDLPRWDLEYDSFWRQRYADQVARAENELRELDRCAGIIQRNLALPIHEEDDLEVMLTMVELCRHNARFFTRMADCEDLITTAGNMHWIDRKQSLEALRSAAMVFETHIRERKVVMRHLVKVWERTRLPKGMSTKSKKYLHARDRAHHFANRTPDMSYHVIDEVRLDMEGHLRALRRIIKDYEKTLKDSS